MCCERAPGVVAVHEPEAAGHRAEGGGRLRQALGVVDRERKPRVREALLGTSDHRLGEVDPERPPFGEPFGQRRSRQPRPAGDVEAIPVGFGGEEVQTSAGEVSHPRREHLVVGDGDVPPGIPHAGLLGRLILVVNDRLSRHRYRA